MNVQYAIKDGHVYVLEVNPRASRTVPFVSKATGVPLPKIAVGLMLGKKLTDFTHLTGGIVNGRLPVSNYFVKSPVFPFAKFPGVDPALGPEMRSTGEVMGVGATFGEAFAKAQLAAGTPIPDHGALFISVNDRDKPAAVAVAAKFREFGFDLFATRGTAAALKRRRPSVQDSLQSQRRAAERCRLDKRRQAQPGHLHDYRQSLVPRRTDHSAQRRHLPHALHHDDERGESRRRSRGLSDGEIRFASGACRNFTRPKPFRPPAPDQSSGS